MREQHVDMEPDPDEEEMKDMRLNDKRERHWSMVFKDNGGGVDDQKIIIRSKWLDVYINEKTALIRGGYSAELSGSDGKKVLWGVVDDHVVEEIKEHDQIGLKGFLFYFF